MRSAQVSRRFAEALLEEGAAFDDVLAAQESLSMRCERDEVERYIEDMERALAQERREAHYSVPRFNGKAAAGRAVRRAVREKVRALPTSYVPRREDARRAA